MAITTRPWPGRRKLTITFNLCTFWWWCNKRKDWKETGAKWTIRMWESEEKATNRRGTWLIDVFWIREMYLVSGETEGSGKISRLLNSLLDSEQHRIRDHYQHCQWSGLGRNPKRMLNIIDVPIPWTALSNFSIWNFFYLFPRISVILLLWLGIRIMSPRPLALIFTSLRRFRWRFLCRKSNEIDTDEPFVLRNSSDKKRVPLEGVMARIAGISSPIDKKRKQGHSLLMPSAHSDYSAWSQRSSIPDDQLLPFAQFLVAACCVLFDYCSFEVFSIIQPPTPPSSSQTSQKVRWNQN